MEQPSPAYLSAPYWYGKPGAIEHWFCGVFEGGGAKGVAYTGALLAMKEKDCWFGSVAGASAGAITAALVASGLSPEEMENATDCALRKLHTRAWAGLRRLQKATGYYPSDGLRDWLDCLLRKQVERSTGSMTNANVTFAQLYAVTAIELNVVAADLSLKRQIVLSHNDTPNCVVADAVVASCSIPFAFPSRLLQVPEGNEGKHLYHHTIVDGGVWSNFPLFVFEDRAFRRFYKRAEQVRPEPVLGFVLKEADAPAPPRGEEVGFVDPDPLSGVRAKEWASDGESAVAEPAGLASKFGAWALYPFSLLGRFAELNAGKVDRGRWPTPRSTPASNLARSVNGLLGGTHPLLFGLLACAVVAVGAWEVISFFGTDQIDVLRKTDWAQPMTYAVRPVTVILTLLIVAVSILVVFVSFLGVATNFILLRASRRILYGLVTTYVAGPGAPDWVQAERSNIIALPIPPKVHALSFEMPAKERQDLIASARQVAFAKLTLLLSEEKRTA
jgi:predicted acylesterase/phospholipase RssA